ncbi:hypothetical protein [Aurantiacibacter gangjinensis]|uniref:Uncharacterized protein n=1 Tax=Aurantiacibacter gangjinensis TaxID=502682 RepID=A0A0G9MQ51_9SPHN|nr:hypothetical protein [Aurantiacibacter gangjinensis]APE28669.1 hypothetical protein BMF35_a1840 [Aurantiacibacter gangjinensis]KLE32840.1 hypothetical protein AAW01_02095 [Aurantiacibacter gangjinensis]
MADLERQLRHDRTLRNAAKRLVKFDIACVKGDVSDRGVGGRALDRAKDGAAGIAESTAEYADTHRTQVGIGIALAMIAAVAYLFRDRLADMIFGLFEKDEEPLERAAKAAEQFADDVRSYFD